MRITRELAGLLCDPGPIHRAKQELERLRDKWRQSPLVTQLLCELARYGEGQAIGRCPVLSQCMSSSDQARSIIDPLVAEMCRGLRFHPYGHVPFRHHYSSGIAQLQLARSGRAALTLLCYDASTRNSAVPVRSICFSDTERHEICVAGKGEGWLYSIAGQNRNKADLRAEKCTFEPGLALCFANGRQTKLVDAVEGRLLILRLAREQGVPAPSREFRLEDGALLHSASGARDESREEMALALLGRMGRTDAAGVMVARALGEGSKHLRWQALRHALAIDAAKGFAALVVVSRKAGDPLQESAKSLANRLVAEHPELLLVERESCPA